MKIDVTIHGKRAQTATFDSIEEARDYLDGVNNILSNFIPSVPASEPTPEPDFDEVADDEPAPTRRGKTVKKGKRKVTDSQATALHREMLKEGDVTSSAFRIKLKKRYHASDSSAQTWVTKINKKFKDQPHKQIILDHARI